MKTRRYHLAFVGAPLHRPWGRLHVWRGGRGPTVLAIHGLGGSGRYWATLAMLVGDRHTVVAPDLGGFGHSDKPTLRYDRTFHLDNLDAAVADIAGPIVVVGHSLGGVLAALWAARNPQRVAALALVATPFPATGQGMPTRDQRLSEQDRRAVRQGMYRGFQTAWPVVTFPIRSRVFSRAVIRDYMRHTLQSYWDTAQAVLWDSTTESELAPLAHLSAAPALLLSAADDKRVGIACAERWAELLPHAKRSVVTGGHQLLLRGGFTELASWLGRY